MLQSKPHELEDIFHAALEIESPTVREQFLDSACQSDDDLRARVEALLSAHEAAGSFLVAPTVDRPSEGPGTVIGRYKILQLIGEGGFGTVYMAEQTEPVQRKVALKIIKLGMDTKQVIARFEAERQALAMMDHPNIARVFDAGSTESGRPYFVMELVKGIPITEYCDRRNVATGQRLGLFLDVCQAVHHAHQKGIIHRDIKPSNVMVTMHDGRPVPKIIDFGIAKATNQRLTERTLFTEYHQFVGTPQYMSPEQAEMSGLDIDTRSDLYSLGALLYELMTGTPPFDAKTLQQAGYAEIQRIVCEVEPPWPSTRVATLIEHGSDIGRLHGVEPASLSRLIRGDLDWIVMKAMEKDRTRRYETALELAADIQRHLRHEPVLAGPPRLSYKLRKFVQRHRIGVIATTAIVLILIAGCALTTIGFVQASYQRDAARAAKALADKEAARSAAIADFLQDMLISTDPEQAMALDVDVESVLETARNVFGDDHATVAATLGSLAVQLQSAGNHPDAEPLLRESVRIWQEHYGQDNLNVGIALNRLGTLLRIKGDHQAAEDAYQESLRITQEHLGPDSLLAADVYVGLAEVLQNRSEYSEAEVALRESLRIRKACAPHQAFQIAMTLNSLFNVMVLAGKTVDVEPVLRECVAAFRAALPPDSKTIAKIEVQAASYYLDRSDLDEAETRLREALAILERQPEPSSYYRDVALHLMASIVDRRDDGSPEYVEKRLDFVDFVRHAGGKQNAQFGAFLAKYASYMSDHDRPVEAIALAMEALEKLPLASGGERGITTALTAITDASWDLACDPSRSRTDYELALRAAQSHQSQDPGQAAAKTLAALQYRLGRYQQALQTLTNLEHDAEAPQLDDPPQMALLVMIHHQLGQPSQADIQSARLAEQLTTKSGEIPPEDQRLINEAQAMIGQQE